MCSASVLPIPIRPHNSKLHSSRDSAREIDVTNNSISDVIGVSRNISSLSDNDKKNDKFQFDPLTKYL